MDDIYKVKTEVEILKDILDRIEKLEAGMKQVKKAVNKLITSNNIHHGMYK